MTPDMLYHKPGLYPESRGKGGKRSVFTREQCASYISYIMLCDWLLAYLNNSKVWHNKTMIKPDLSRCIPRGRKRGQRVEGDGEGD